MAGTMASFRSRYGADNAGAMQQVRQAISIDADDWDDASYTGSSVVQSSTSQTVSGAGSRIMPPAPPMRPLPADFGRMSPPETDSKLPPVTPPRTADGQAGYMVSPVPSQHIPRSPEQALQDFSGRSPVQESGGDAASEPGRGTTQADRARQSGKISPVMPPSPRQVQQNRMGVENHTSISNTEQLAAQPLTRVTPSHPSIPAGGIQQGKDGTVAASGAAAATAAAAGSVMPGRANQSRISPAQEAPPQAMHPVSGSAVSPSRQQAASAGRQALAGASARVTPTAPHKPPVQAAAQTMPTQKRAAATPPSPSPQNQAHAAAKPHPDVIPADRTGRPAVTPARRERKPERPDSASRLDVSPGVRAPDMVTPPPTGQPHALRRSAQPLKNKVTPETPKKGGTRNRKRKRKK